MVLKQEDIDNIINFVKVEPRTIQEVSKNIKKSWITTDSYLKQIKSTTGLLNIKTFRKGTQGALKLVYYNYGDFQTDNLKESLYHQIKVGRKKTDFDFFEIFQFIPDEKKKVYYHKKNSSQELISLLRQAKNTVCFFSGNLSFINEEKNDTIINIFEELVKRKVIIKIICRINIASINNLNRINLLIQKYPGFIEIKHCFQPLRGVLIDESAARFKTEEDTQQYKEGELFENIKIYYEIFDTEWITWLQKVFWEKFRFSIDSESRIKQLKLIK